MEAPIWISSGFVAILQQPLCFCFYLHFWFFCLLIFWLSFWVTECFCPLQWTSISWPSSCFLTIPLEILVNSCYRKYRILLEARKNVPDTDGRPSLLPVGFNTPEGRECQVYRQTPMVGLWGAGKHPTNLAKVRKRYEETWGVKLSCWES